jgi:hypothetical protein
MSSFSDISDFNEELAMIHLRIRTGAAGRRNRSLTDSHTRAASLSLALRINYAPAAWEVKTVQGSYLEVVLPISGGVADRRGNTLAAGRGPRKGLRTEERRWRREDGGEKGRED